VQPAGADTRVAVDATQRIEVARGGWAIQAEADHAIEHRRWQPRRDERDRAADALDGPQPRAQRRRRGVVHVNEGGFFAAVGENRLVRVGSWRRPRAGLGCGSLEPAPFRAASMPAIPILRIVIIAWNTRLRVAEFGSAKPCVSAMGVICQEMPRRSWHRPQALSLPPLPTMALQ
jgi:hypothetical protein